MIKVLFICHGNICRSPMAEYIFKDMAEKSGLYGVFEIASAATSTEEIGNDIHHGTREILRKYQIPFEKRRARQMSPEDYRKYDYLIGMDDANIRNMKRITGDDPEGKIYSLMSFCGSRREVADPWYTGDFETTYQDIVSGCRAFLQYAVNQL